MIEPFRVPADETYTALLGRAVYNFAYLEWGVIYTVETLSPGYLSEYAQAQRPMPSGQVAAAFRETLNARVDLPSDLKEKLATCAARFTKLVDDRTRLIHAHPYTADGGHQQLSYQGRLPPATWPDAGVEAVARDFDAAACDTNEVFYELKKFLEKPSGS
jgi:hypothetical protein